MDPTTKCFVTAKDFHDMYYQCFAGQFQPTYPSQDYLDLKYALIDLMTIDATDRDNTIIETASKIKEIATKKPMPVILSQLIDAGEKIKNGKAFWNMFSFPFEKADKVKAIMLERIKALQDDFSKHGIANSGSLINCLEDETFCAPKPKETKAAETKEGYHKDGYFKEGGKSNAKIHYDPLSSQSSQADILKSVNWYSEKSLDAINKQYPQAAAQARNIRETFVQTARNGGLITDKVTITQNPVTKIAELIIHPVDRSHADDYPIISTMQALVYDEIVNGRIHTEEDMQRFVMEKFRDPNDQRFFRFFSNPRIFEQMFIKCWFALRNFDEFLKSTLPETPKPNETDPAGINAEKIQSEKAIKEANMYSELSLETLDKYYPTCAAQLKNIRDEFVNRAKAGEIIRECAVIDKNTEVQVKGYPGTKEDDVYPYCLTMNALVYDEIAKGRIQTLEQMIKFIESKCADINDPRFITYLQQFGTDKFQMMVSVAQNQFKDYFENRV